jgi:amino acid adenylation domain-containing protein
VETTHRIHPPSFGQQRLWFVDRMRPGSPLYNVPVAVRLTGPLDVDVLRRGLDLIVARHDALRTVFEERAGEPVQVVHAQAAASLTVVDVADEAQARRRIRDEARLPFDLTTGPLLRVLLLRLGTDDHYLVITLHHIVSDGWSLSVLLAELGECYAALAAGRLPRLPELGMRYPDFAVWQREEASGPDGKQALDYWVEQLRGAPVLLELPTDRERPDRQSFRGAVRSFDVPDELAKALRELRVVPSGTLFMTLLAAYCALLSRYCGQEDVVVGTAVGGRPSADTERLVGFFVNSVPLRVDLSGDPTFAELVSRVRDVTLDGVEYAGTPFERIVETIAPQRDLGYAPVFQAQLMLQSTPPLRLRLPGITVADPELVYTGTAKVDLTVAFAERDGRLHADLEYNTDLFDPDTIEGMTGHLLAFLAAVAADPGIRIGDVPLLTGPEHRRAVVDWNDTALPLPAASTVLDLIAARVAANGAAVAVADGTESLTYAELDRRANRLAHRLRAAGVGREVPVALCLERSAALVVAVLAVWKAGGAYVPLDPSWPARRLEYMLSDTASRVALVDGTTRSRMAGLLGALDLIDVHDPDLLTRPDTPPQVELRGDGLAYVIYTSGSTGTPKGVVVPHTGVVNQIAAFDALLQLSTADVWAGVTTLSFDPSVLELLLPLASGARLVVFGAAEIADPSALRDRLVSSGATVLQATPSRWRMLLGEGGVPPGVRIRLCGGEVLTRDLADALLADGAALWNIYGPTETTVWASATRIEPSPAPIELGPPIGNMRIYVLDKAMRPVPVGVVGEIHVGGPGMTRGYHNRPGLTARQFLPDPLGDTPGARLYATGDLARYRSTGRLEFFGRADHQVKVRGYRIEPGEIEAALRGHPLIAEAAVVAWARGTDDTRLAAYVVPAQPVTDPAGLWSSIRPRLADSLPDYMIPSAVVVLDALPMTPTAKVDRGALPEPDWDSVRETGMAEPATPVERALAGMWREFLGLPEVGRHDDFFRLGGHSMLAARLLARVREYFMIDVPLLTLFESRTVAEFADALLRLQPTPGHVAAIATGEGF